MADYPSRTPATLVLALEALGLLALASIVALGGTDSDASRTFLLGLAGFLVLFAVLVGLAATSVLRGGRFGVGFGITWQLFQALTAASMLRGGLLTAGGIGLVLAIIAIVLLMRLVSSTPTPLDQD
ncbi:hypothetical protein [Brachybacterium nesterenkovii]|uniref:hypothetical protein n=1 Tax=Brachybacterium nesterenkovii TaxID=47847 RepID=UPI00321BFAD5